MATPAQPNIKHPNVAAGHLSRWLLLAGAIVWLWSAYAPVETDTWAIEQVATAIGIVVVLWLARTVQFDNISKWCFFLLFCIHTVGTHYTYSLTPYPYYSELMFGSSINEWFGWQRNHYDRFVHLAFGLLMTHPLRQALTSRLRAIKPPSAWLAGHIILSVSALYELLEWGAAIIFGGDVGMAYLGTQGDVWDAQADIALAGLGWFIATTIQFAFTRFRSAYRTID